MCQSTFERQPFGREPEVEKQGTTWLEFRPWPSAKRRQTHRPSTDTSRSIKGPEKTLGTAMRRYKPARLLLLEIFHKKNGLPERRSAFAPAKRGCGATDESGGRLRESLHVIRSRRRSRSAIQAAEGAAIRSELNP